MAIQKFISLIDGKQRLLSPVVSKSEGDDSGKIIALNSSGLIDKSLISLDKSDVGLGNVDNTSDIDKPVSTAQAEAIQSSITDVFTITNQQSGDILVSNGTTFENRSRLELSDGGNF